METICERYTQISNTYAQTLMFYTLTYNVQVQTAMYITSGLYTYVYNLIFHLFAFNVMFIHVCTCIERQVYTPMYITSGLYTYANNAMCIHLCV